jgi:hypothetical protein
MIVNKTKSKLSRWLCEHGYHAWRAYSIARPGEHRKCDRCKRVQVLCIGGWFDDTDQPFMSIC